MVDLKTRFNTKAFTGASLFSCFLVMLITSFLLFTQQHSNLVALSHTLIGMLMMLMVIWHLAKNRKPLKHYLTPFKKYNNKYSITLISSLLLVAYFAVAPLLRLWPAMTIYEWGQTLKVTDKGNVDDEVIYIERALSPDTAVGQTITVELKKGAYFLWPQYAIWLETLDGKFVQPLFVTSATGTNNFINKVAKRDPSQVFTSHAILGADVDPDQTFLRGQDPRTKETRMRPEALPVFLHQLGIQTRNGLYLPTNASLLADGYSSATMTDNFIYHATLPKPLSGQYVVKFEINHSFDFNEYYSSNRFPDDAIYSGNGFSAQPSVIYQAIINFDLPEQILKMNLIGRGHHSGKNGQIYQDVSNLTTALELVGRLLITAQ